MGLHANMSVGGQKESVTLKKKKNVQKEQLYQINEQWRGNAMNW